MKTYTSPLHSLGVVSVFAASPFLLAPGAKGGNANGVMLGSFDAEMTSATLTGIHVRFDSLPEREYDIQWCAAPGAEWQTVINVTAAENQTSVVVSYPDDADASGFFRAQAK